MSQKLTVRLSDELEQRSLTNFVTNLLVTRCKELKLLPPEWTGR